MASDWERYALITYLAEELGENQAFGKKAVQKVVYLLQELVGVPVGLRYTFYTYGVFSPELGNTLDLVEGLNGIKVGYNPSQNSYQLERGDNSELILAKGNSFIEEYSAELDSIVSLAKYKTAKKLELISTIVFVAKTEKLADIGVETDLVSRVKELKPKFDEAEIKEEVDNLRRLEQFTSL